jgi:hypothetical protein
MNKWQYLYFFFMQMHCTDKTWARLNSHYKKGNQDNVPVYIYIYKNIYLSIHFVYIFIYEIKHEPLNLLPKGLHDYYFFLCANMFLYSLFFFRECLLWRVYAYYVYNRWFDAKIVIVYTYSTNDKCLGTLRVEETRGNNWYRCIF